MHHVNKLEARLLFLYLPLNRMIHFNHFKFYVQLQKYNVAIYEDKNIFQNMQVADFTVEDWCNHQISNLLQKKTTKTKQWTIVGNNI